MPATATPGRKPGDESYGPRIRKLRESLGLTLTEVADALMVGLPYLSRVERGVINEYTGQPVRFSEEGYYAARNVILSLGRERVHEMQKILEEEATPWQVQK